MSKNRQSKIEMIHYNDELPKVNYSEYISKIMGFITITLPIYFRKLKELLLNIILLPTKLKR